MVRQNSRHSWQQIQCTTGNLQNLHRTGKDFTENNGGIYLKDFPQAQEGMQMELVKDGKWFTWKLLVLAACCGRGSE